MPIRRRITIDIEVNDHYHAFLIHNDILAAITRRTTVFQSTGPKEIIKGEEDDNTN